MSDVKYDGSIIQAMYLCVVKDCTLLEHEHTYGECKQNGFGVGAGESM